MIHKETFDSVYEGFDDEIIVDIIDTFLDEFEERIETIRKAVADRDFDVIHKATHKLKGSFGAFYATEEVELANTLMNKGKNNDDSEIDSLLEEFLKNSLALKQEIIELRAKHV